MSERADRSIGETYVRSLRSIPQGRQTGEDAAATKIRAYERRRYSAAPLRNTASRASAANLSTYPRPKSRTNECSKSISWITYEETRSGGEPAADGAPRWSVIADYSERGGDRDGEDQAHAAPDPAPE